MCAERDVAPEEIRQAAALLRAGKLVAFPTETVYGLGANALDPEAVARIFAAKGRPTSSPIIVHISSMEMVKTVVAEWPGVAQCLAEKFWPGPLTLVLKKQPAVPDLVTAGLPTVGVRLPAHPVALALIERAQLPIAAPSANRFTQLSPTTAEHVREGLGGLVDYILDGGPCVVGIESTVLSLTSSAPVLLRPGGISRQQIEAVIGPVTLQARPSSEAHPSPGMHPRHYSPRTRLLLVTNGDVPNEGLGAYLQLHHPP
jgi:L-threonylcarbamoyladenylate synthase